MNSLSSSTHQHRQRVIKEDMSQGAETYSSASALNLNLRTHHHSSLRRQISIRCRRPGPGTGTILSLKVCFIVLLAKTAAPLPILTTPQSGSGSGRSGVEDPRVQGLTLHPPEEDWLWNKSPQGRDDEHVRMSAT